MLNRRGQLPSGQHDGTRGTAIVTPTRRAWTVISICTATALSLATVMAILYCCSCVLPAGRGLLPLRDSIRVDIWNHPASGSALVDVRALPGSRHSQTAAHTVLVRRIPTADIANLAWIRSHALFFLHVPKTAGQSFTEQLHALCQPYQRLFSSNSEPDSAPPPRLDLTFMQASPILALAHPANRAEFHRVYGQHVCAAGHADIHVAAAYRQGGNRTVEFVSMLRHPVERVYSHFCDIVRGVVQGHERLALHDLAIHAPVFPTWFAYINNTEDLVSPHSFQLFLETSVEHRADNWHARAYSGCLSTSALLASELTMCGNQSAMLEEAKAQLAGFLFVGVQDRYELSMELLRLTLRNESADSHSAIGRLRRRAGPGEHREGKSSGGTQLASGHLNHNWQKGHCIDVITGRGSLTLELDAQIRRIESLDLDLYETASRLVEQRAAYIAGAGKSIQTP